MNDQQNLPQSPQPSGDTPPHTAQDDQGVSYVDDYQPPAKQPSAPQQGESGQAPSNKDSQPASDQHQPAQPAQPQQSQPQPAQPSQPQQQQQSSQPTQPAQPAQSAQPAQPTQPQQNTGSSQQPAKQAQPSQPDQESLEAQNIFVMLGIDDANNTEKEAFLDELQQVIWEDFLDQDVELLITDEEMGGLKKIMDNKDVEEEQRQEEIVVYLERLIPDLEEIMLEKALELKEDMIRERLLGVRDYYQGRAEQLALVDEAERLMNDGQWKSAADKLNSIAATTA